MIFRRERFRARRALVLPMLVLRVQVHDLVAAQVLANLLSRREKRDRRINRRVRIDAAQPQRVHHNREVEDRIAWFRIGHTSGDCVCSRLSQRLIVFVASQHDKRDEIGFLVVGCYWRVSTRLGGALRRIGGPLGLELRQW
jgi:hypothetical protein